MRRRRRRIAAPYVSALGASEMRRLLAAVLCGFIAWSAVSAYSAVWLAAQLHLRSGIIAVAFGCTGIAGTIGSVLGGHAVARYGSGRVMLAGSISQAVLSLLLFNAHEAAAPAIAGLACVTLLQPLRGVAQRSILSAITPEAGRESAFVCFRAAMNLGVLAGPALLSGLLLGGWIVAHAGVTILFGAASVSAALVAKQSRPALVAEPGAAMRTAAGSAERFSMSRIARDRRVAALVLVTTGAWTLVAGIEIVLPAIVTERHQIPVAAWGVAYAAASLLIVLIQPPIGQRLSRLRIAPRLAAGAGALGAALAPALVLGGAATVCCALAMLVVGEVVWGPPSEEIVVATAPPGRSLEYLGAVGTSIWLGESCAGVLGFIVAGDVGVRASWISFVLVGVATSAAYFVVARGRQQPATEPAGDR